MLPLEGSLMPAALSEDLSLHGPEWDLPRHAAALATKTVLLVDGAVVGTTVVGSPNSFLSPRGSFVA